MRLLRAHRRRQAEERLEAGDRWVESAYVFTNPVGEPLNPDYLTRRFAYLVLAAAARNPGRRHRCQERAGDGQREHQKDYRQHVEGADVSET